MKLPEVNNTTVIIWGRPEQDTTSKRPGTKCDFLWWANSNSLKPLFLLLSPVQSFGLNVVPVAICFHPTNAAKVDGVTPGFATRACSLFHLWALSCRLCSQVLMKLEENTQLRV